MQKQHLTNIIKAEALRLGFSACGISKAAFLEAEVGHYNEWLNKGYQAEMKYLEKNIEKRLDPTKLVENSQSIISVIHQYYPPKSNNILPPIANYAYGKDYHIVIKDKLNLLLTFITQKVENASGRAFVDTAPILERRWAQLSGLGWIGKNTNLINKNIGSYLFIGELLINIELEYDKPIKDACGNCKKCIDACPTGAITNCKQINSNKCISYQSIENKGEIPTEIEKKITHSFFGCDICQQVCPWNKTAKPTSEPQFHPKPEILQMTKLDWQNLDKTKYNQLFKNTAIERIGYEGLKRNIAIYYSNQTKTN